MKPPADIDLPAAPSISSHGGASSSRQRPAHSPRIRPLPTPQPTNTPSAPTPPSTVRPRASSPESPAPDTDLAPRLRLLRIVLASALLLLLAALAYHQLVRSPDYTAQAQRQSLRLQLTPAPRGIIYDREHRVLAGNKLRTDAVLSLGGLRHEFAAEERRLFRGSIGGTTSVSSKPDAHQSGINPLKPPPAPDKSSPTPNTSTLAARARLAVVQRHFDRINALLGRTHTTIDTAQLERHFTRARLTPFVLIPNLSPAESTLLTSSLSSTDVIHLTRTPERWYPHGHTAAHVLGRVRPERIRAPVGEHFPILNYFDTTGDSGLEKQYDALLRGAPSSAILRLDASGFSVAAKPARNPVGQRARTRSENPAPGTRHLIDDNPSAPLAATAATPGRDLTLSLDLDLQRAAETALDATTGSARGSAVAIDVRTGEILALVSRPGFDLNAVSPAISAATKQQLDTSGAWLNRATQALYPPGSTFKIFTVLAGLRSGALNSDTVHRCDGFLQIGNRRFPCHHAAGHGELTLATALAHSCNVFAYQTGLAAGPAALAAEARRFHFDQPTGIDLPADTNNALVPDPSWKIGDNRGPWTDGDTANFAIGQGFLRISPLQAACAMASLARRETLTVPTLLRQPGRNPTGDRPREPLDISDTNYAALLASLRNVVQTGIGREAQVPGIKIGGKTGTAQIESPAGMKNVAWFLAFAPVENPQIAVAIALEGDTPGVEYTGAQHAAPIARELLGTYFDKQAKR